MKFCPKCGVEKPTREFSKDARRKDGLAGHCKGCRAAYHRINREAVSARRKAQRAENWAEVRAKERARDARRGKGKSSV